MFDSLVNDNIKPLTQYMYANGLVDNGNPNNSYSFSAQNFKSNPKSISNDTLQFGNESQSLVQDDSTNNLYQNSETETKKTCSAWKKFGIILGTVTILGTVALWLKGRGENKGIIDAIKEGWNSLFKGAKAETKIGSKAKGKSPTGKTEKDSTPAVKTGKAIFENNAENKIDNKKIREELAKLYNDDSLKALNKEDSINMFYHKIWHNKYDSIRHTTTPYANRANYNPNLFHQAKYKETDGICVNVTDWTWRSVKGQTQRNPVDRISLNVYPDIALINKLDEFLIKKAPKGSNYKLADAGKGWTIRHDPITMYFPEKLSPEIKAKIAKIASPHARPVKKECMLGTKLADGVYSVPEPTKDDIMAILKRAKKLGLDESFLLWIKDSNEYSGANVLKADKQGNLYVHASPGIVKAIDAMLDDIEKIVQKMS